MSTLCKACAALLIILTRSQAADHKCTYGHRTNIYMDPEGHQSELIIPQVDTRYTDQPQVDSDSVICSFKVHNVDTESSRQMVLEGVKAAADVEAANDTYLTFEDPSHLAGSTGSNCSQAVPAHEGYATVTLGMFRVIPLPPNGFVKVHLQRRSSANNLGGVALKATLVDDDFCGRHMTLFQGSCYAVVPDPLMAVGKISRDGSAQLASFSNRAQIRDFIEANKASRVPLNLTSVNRIGLFYNNVTRKVTRLTTSEGRCALQEMANSAEFTAPSIARNAICGSLKVNESCELVVEFANCLSQMPSLISFPVKPANFCLSCTDVTKGLWRRSLEYRYVPVPWYKSPAMIAMFCMFALLIVVGLVHGCRLCLRTTARQIGGIL